MAAQGFFAAQGFAFAAQGFSLAAQGFFAAQGFSFAAQGFSLAAQGFVAAQGFTVDVEAAQGLAFAELITGIVVKPIVKRDEAVNAARYCNFMGNNF